MGNFICDVCGNSEDKYIGYIGNRAYCRKCIRFRGVTLETPKESKINSSELFIDYQLSPKQREISEQIVAAYLNHDDVLVHAVCGAGKTELVLDVIHKALSLKQKVCFAIPRRDVVIELSSRLREHFRNSTVISLYGGSTELLEGDIVVLTTHQLYRYQKYFDLLVIDEIDAFPFKDNEILATFFKRAVKGNLVVLTATPSEQLLADFKKKKHVIFELLVRYHNHPIPLPHIVIRVGYLKIVFLWQKLRVLIRDSKPVLVFVPTIRIGEIVYRLLNLLIEGGCNVNSQSSDRSETIERFRRGEYKYLVTTSILERGITIANLQVIIYDSDSFIYDSAALIQISGRVGRKANSPGGEVCFLANKRTKSQTEAIESIRRANTFL